MNLSPPKQFRIEIDAIRGLVIQTTTGQIRQRRPTAYQDVRGFRRIVPTRCVIAANQTVTFELEGYHSAETLVIDPVLTYPATRPETPLR